MSIKTVFGPKFTPELGVKRIALLSWIPVLGGALLAYSGIYGLSELGVIVWGVGVIIQFWVGYQHFVR